MNLYAEAEKSHELLAFAILAVIIDEELIRYAIDLGLNNYPISPWYRHMASLIRGVLGTVQGRETLGGGGR